MSTRPYDSKGWALDQEPDPGEDAAGKPVMKFAFADPLKRCSCSQHEGANPVPTGDFRKRSRSKDGLQSWCKTCQDRASRARRLANPEPNREQARRWRQANPELAREIGRAAYRARAEDARDYARRWRRQNPEARAAQHQREREQLRDQVFEHYGHACACCGATENLSIDHINGEGRAHRLELFGRANAAGKDFWRWLRRNGFPDGFQTLCKRCGSSKGTGTACRLNHGAE